MGVRFYFLCYVIIMVGGFFGNVIDFGFIFVIGVIFYVMFFSFVVFGLVLLIIVVNCI